MMTLTQTTMECNYIMARKVTFKTPLVILIHNEKGGPGKTTLTVNLACALAKRGWRVMVLDGDPQGHATIRLGIKKSHGLYDLLVREAEWKDVARGIAPERFGIPGETLPTGKLWVVPSNVETRNISQSISDSMLVRQRIEELAGIVDIVLIDTSPTPSLLHGAFFSAAKFIIYPTELTYSSFDGLTESILHRMAADKERQQKWGIPPVKVAGIIPTKYKKTSEHDTNLAQLNENFPNLVWPLVRERTAWQASESYQVPVYNYEPNGKAALELWELVDRLESVVNGAAA